MNEAASLYQDHAELLPSWPTIKYMLAELVDGLGANKLVSEVSQRDLQVYFAKRRDERSSASVNREIENARSVWRRANETEYDIGKMPKWSQLMLKVPNRPPRELEVLEEAKLFLALRNDVSDAVEFLLKSGWRRGEVLGLRWQDVSIPRKVAVTRIKGGDIVTRPLTTALVEIIARQEQCEDEEGKPFVFTYICQKSRGTVGRASATRSRPPRCANLCQGSQRRRRRQLSHPRSAPHARHSHRARHRLAGGREGGPEAQAHRDHSALCPRPGRRRPQRARSERVPT